MDEITIDDKTYISSKRAAEITGYAKDYVGQLCREGHVEARMVGRSWYVYEPSIRAHRFGEEPETASAAEPEKSEPAEGHPEPENKGWEGPKYTAEVPHEIPAVQPKTIEDLLPPAEETLTDMQEAWREWFERRQASVEPEIEAEEEVIEVVEEETVEETVPAAEEEIEVAIPLHHIEEEVEEEVEEAEPVQISPVQPPARLYADVVPPARREPTTYMPAEDAAPIEPSKARIIEERIIPAGTKGKRRTGRTATPIAAVLIALSLCSIAVTLIGTGLSDRYINTLGAENKIIDFIVGTREFSR
jgi:hypothetical protein